MKYISFIYAMQNIVNTTTYSENRKPKPQDVIDAQEYLNETIDSYVRIGKIMDINKPKLNVYYDRFNHSMSCVPVNVLTMHMSLTFKYDMSDSHHYEHFKKLIDTEPEFVSDVNRRYKMAIRKAELRSKETFPGLQYYVDVFGFPEYNPKDDMSILETLEHEFNIEKYNNSFDDFKKAVYKLIERIDSLYVMTGGSFKADAMWGHLFDTSIRRRGRILWRNCRTKAFDSLQFIYSPQQIQTRINLDEPKTYEYKAKPKIKHHPRTDRDPRMVFMGLQIGFTQKQLKKRFRKLAVKYHPDKHGGDNDKFLYLKECYDALLKGSS